MNAINRNLIYASLIEMSEPMNLVIYVSENLWVLFGIARLGAKTVPPKLASAFVWLSLGVAFWTSWQRILAALARVTQLSTKSQREH